MGPGDSWTMSGQQWGAWNATYGPRGADGQPVPLWDPKTGLINKSVVDHWKKYDLRLILEQNWKTLAPKLRGKIHISVGDVDSYYLNNAVHLLDEFLARADSPDVVVTNGDYSCDTEFIGVCDDAAFESARECLAKLRVRFGPKLQSAIGDHELGKMSLFGGKGGFRLASWRRATTELALQPFWRTEIGNYVLIGLTSSLLAFPVYEPEALPEERQDWAALREAHLSEVRRAFAALKPEQRALLFCHDPTALPFLWRDETVRGRLPQVEQTIIGHLHSNLFYRQSQLLAGMPTIRFLGNSIRRMSHALNEARCWREFKTRLCPSIAGIELLKDGGYCELRIDEGASRPVEFHFRPLRR